MYNGHVFIWNHSTQGLVKSFEVSDQPVRAGKFVARKQWIVTGSDDMQIRVYNYNTMEKVKDFEAHGDYIRHARSRRTARALPFVSRISLRAGLCLPDLLLCTRLSRCSSHHLMT